MEVLAHQLAVSLTIQDALQQARRDIDDIDARLLLQHVLNVNHAHLIAHPEQLLTPEQTRRFHLLIKRRTQGDPVAYLTGQREFYGFEFAVTPAVLIPRPETELLVDLALARIPCRIPYSVLDLGTGSGAIALSIAKHRALASITAVDISAAAVALAQANARQLDVKNVRIIQSDWFEELAGERFDLIVSNPPYIADGDPHLSQGDLRFEPGVALTSGRDGLDCIRSIIASAPAYLAEGGALLLEHGYDQAAACRQLLSAAGFVAVYSRPDLADIMRVSGGRLGSFAKEAVRMRL
ncbi:MAG TPA: peptide chain release factor N(5)-glutamine methyltransferase [Nitrosospira sp.]|nr:peptide chain release factor N(5)-glutamine methyltransferase [Nitrosospira sp.]